MYTFAGEDLIYKVESEDIEKHRKDLCSQVDDLRTEYFKYLCLLPDIREIMIEENLKFLEEIFGAKHRDAVANLLYIDPLEREMCLSDYVLAFQRSLQSIHEEDDRDNDGVDSGFDGFDYSDLDPGPNYDELLEQIAKFQKEFNSSEDPETLKRNFTEVHSSYITFKEESKRYTSSKKLELLISSIMPAPTELLLLTEAPDRDLINVMKYRIKKNPNILVMDLKSYGDLAESGFQMPSVTHLGILHHSGKKLLETGIEEVIKRLPDIGKSLPNCSRFTERGCGMDDYKTLDKDSPIILTERYNPKKIEGFKLKELKVEKRGKEKDLRQSTIDFDEKDGRNLASFCLKQITKSLIDGGLGQECQTPINIKYYIQGYVGSSTGAISDKGVDSDDRWKKHPKAVRFFSPPKPLAGAAAGAGAAAAAAAAAAAEEEDLSVKF